MTSPQQHPAIPEESLLLVNGYIHNTADPYATALHIDAQGIIAWLGSDESAEATITRMSGGVAPRVVDLDGGLVTPAFIDALATDTTASGDADVADPRQLVTVVGDQQPSPHRIVYRSHSTDTATDGDTAAGTCVAGEQLDQLATVLAASTTPPRQLLIQVTSADELEQVLTVLEESGSANPPHPLMRARHRLWLADTVTVSHEQVQRMRDTHVSIVITPPAAGTKDAADFQVPVADILAAGVHLTTGSAGLAPGESTSADLWQAITTLVEHPDPAQRIATRAAFNTVARDGARVLPNRLAQEYMGAGQIRVGATADLTVWGNAELGVQVPDEDSSTRQWSTDARAGSALLPILSSESSSPQLVARIRPAGPILVPAR